jgi:serine/threonine protein phosphatase PrpC
MATPSMWVRSTPPAAAIAILSTQETRSVTEEPSSAILTPPPGLSGEAVVRAAGRSDLGTKHEVNEDRYAVATTRGGAGLLVLCDGMGGMGSGDRAAQTAIDLLVEWLSNDEAGDTMSLATSAVHKADLTVMSSFEPKDGRKPGTTCACVVIRDGMAHMFWVGDSSILLIRDGKVLRRSRPHRMVQDLIDSGSMTEEQAKRSPMRHYLSRSLGGRDDADPVDPEVRPPVPLMVGDRFVLCSDGLTDFVALDEIATIASSHDDPDAATEQLVSLALERQVDDNVTCIVAHVSGEHLDAPDTVGSVWDVGAVSYDLDDDFGSDIRPRPASLPDVPATTGSSEVADPAVPLWMKLALVALVGMIGLCVVVLGLLLAG